MIKFSKEPVSVSVPDSFCVPCFMDSSLLFEGINQPDLFPAGVHDVHHVAGE